MFEFMFPPEATTSPKVKTPAAPDPAQTAYFLLGVPINISSLLVQSPLIFPPNSMSITESFLGNDNLTFGPLIVIVPVDSMIINEVVSVNSRRLLDELSPKMKVPNIFSSFISLGITVVVGNIVIVCPT